MTERTVELRGTGSWTDEVGAGYEQMARDSVGMFNTASQAIWSRIDILSKYSIDDVYYQSQRSTLEGMRVDYYG